MHYRQHPGNTASEYSLLIGLIAVASIAALNLLGNSLSNNYGNINNGLEKDYVSSFLGGSGLMGSGKTGTTGAGSNSPGLNLTATSGGSAQSLQFELNKTSSGENNNTGSEGYVYAVQQSLSIGQQFAKLMEEAAGGDQSYIDWLKDAAKNSFLLAGGQAGYSQIPGVLDGTANLNRDHASTDIMRQTNQAEGVRFIQSSAYQLEQLKKTIMTDAVKATPEQKAQALALVNAEIASLERSYGDVINQYILPGYTNLNLEALRKDFGDSVYSMAWTEHEDAYSSQIQANASTVLNSGSVDHNTAVKTSLQTGVTSSDRATSLEATTAGTYTSKY
jgi:Flp pilus assembly pilin Flp